MFGLSFGEITIILLVAIVAIGPKELPTVVRAVVRTLGQLRGVAHEFRKNFDELAQEAEIQKLREDFMAMPEIIDLEGKPQKVYDISADLKADTAKRPPVVVSSEEAAEQAPVLVERS